jgi:hypothetical protein
MDRYNFRTTSLNNAQLTVELTKRGAKTFGSVQRKQERLQRFIDAEAATAAKRETLRVVIENEQRKVYERSQARANELRRSSRFRQILNEVLGY